MRGAQRDDGGAPFSREARCTHGAAKKMVNGVGAGMFPDYCCLPRKPVYLKKKRHVRTRALENHGTTKCSRCLKLGRKAVQPGYKGKHIWGKICSSGWNKTKKNYVNLGIFKRHLEALPAQRHKGATIRARMYTVSGTNREDDALAIKRSGENEDNH